MDFQAQISGILAESRIRPDGVPVLVFRGAALNPALIIGRAVAAGGCARSRRPSNGSQVRPAGKPAVVPRWGGWDQWRKPKLLRTPKPTKKPIGTRLPS